MDADLLKTLIPFFKRAGLSTDVVATPVLGGGNNRSFRLASGPREYFLKIYFRDPADQRDRLNADFGFATFAWGAGLRSLPEPIAKDEETGAALYEFIHGRVVSAGEINRQAVQQALDFYAALNQTKNSTQARKLPAASEACFSIEEQLSLVDRRLDRLYAIEPNTDIHRHALEFVQGPLFEAWTQTKAQVHEKTKALWLSLTSPLEEEDRCLSPSDFGFHNALATPEGRFKFYDFEYAGWDDPAKMLSDFFLSPKRPVPTVLHSPFLHGVVSGFRNPQQVLHRFQLLFPVFEIKWCCIMLNEFLPVGMKRRMFSQAQELTASKLSAQLEQAKNASTSRTGNT